MLFVHIICFEPDKLFYMKIKRIHARQIIDSRDYPTVETDIELENGVIGRASVPSGASTGKREALELRDTDSKEFEGKSVRTAINNINSTIAESLIGMDSENQKEIDRIMIDLDGTSNKSKLGANSILSVSLANVHAAATSLKIPLYKHFQALSGNESSRFRMPIPMINIMNGGRHAANSTDFQEYMILPINAATFSQAIEMSSNVYHHLANVLTAKGYSTTVGDEGGFAPHIKNGNKEPLDLISEAVHEAGYIIGKDFVFALDVAASEFFDGERYTLKTENKTLNQTEMIEYIETIAHEYPIVSIEDGLAQDDWDGWKHLTEQVGSKIQLVGDDLLVTNIELIHKAVENKVANAVLLKLNQIGTVTETLQAYQMATEAGWRSIISHRSGETEDTTISHLAVGLQTGLIKTGSLARTERTAKYNELLRIEESLGDKAFYGNVFSS